MNASVRLVSSGGTEELSLVLSGVAGMNAGTGVSAVSSAIFPEFAFFFEVLLPHLLRLSSCLELLFFCCLSPLLFGGWKKQ